MAALISVSISVLLLMFLWNGWQRIRLDIARDELFDLRDKTRDFFAARPNGLTDPVYRELRNLINGYIRWGSSLHFLGMLYFINTTPPKLVLYMRHRMQIQFRSEDVMVATFVAQARATAAQTMQKYLLLSSAIWLLYFAFFATLYFNKLLAQNGRHLYRIAARIRPTRVQSIEAFTGGDCYESLAAA